MPSHRSTLLAGLAIIIGGCAADPTLEPTAWDEMLRAATFTCGEYTATNYQHVAAGRAVTYQYGLYAKTKGAGDALGLAGSAFYSPTTTVAETAAGYFKRGACPTDDQPPLVVIAAPVEGATIAGAIWLTATATDDVGVTGFEYQFVAVADGQVKAAIDCGTGPFTVSVDVGNHLLENGDYILRAAATDAAGNRGWSQDVHLTVANTYPVLEFLAPADGATVAGVVTFQARAIDASGITKVFFATNVVGALLCAATVPGVDGVFTCQWDSTQMPNSQYAVIATAVNSQGNATALPDRFITSANSCREFTTTNVVHVAAGRAEQYTVYGIAYARTVGGHDDLGYLGNALWSPTTTVKETTSGTFAAGRCP